MNTEHNVLDKKKSSGSEMHNHHLCVEAGIGQTKLSDETRETIFLFLRVVKLVTIQLYMTHTETEREKLRTHHLWC